MLSGSGGGSGISQRRLLDMTMVGGFNPGALNPSMKGHQNYDKKGGSASVGAQNRAKAPTQKILDQEVPL